MAVRSVRDADVAGKRVLVRVDFNVPLRDGVITDDTRITAALPTIRDLLDRGAAVILVSHLGRPKGAPSDDLRLGPVARRLEEVLGKPVTWVPDVVGAQAVAAVAALKPGEVLLLDNIRFEPGEEKNDPELARKLASIADLYVNDAFGAAHRAHASTEGVARLLPAYAGYLMLGEVKSLGRLLHDPEQPFIAILGGAKVSDKIGVISNLLTKVDALLLGGGMANTFLLAKGVSIGGSLAETDLVDEVRGMIDDAARRGVEILLPVDAVVSDRIDGEGTTVSIDAVPAGQSIFDIGPTTVAAYGKAISGARTVFWNGPMGVFEQPQFAAGTIGVGKAVAGSDAFSVVGGGDSVAALEASGLADRISHLSTGGGASLELVEGRELPGLAALDRES